MQFPEVNEVCQKVQGLKNAIEKLKNSSLADKEEGRWIIEKGAEVVELLEEVCRDKKVILEEASEVFVKNSIKPAISNCIEYLNNADKALKQNQLAVAKDQLEKAIKELRTLLYGIKHILGADLRLKEPSQYDQKIKQLGKLIGEVRKFIKKKEEIETLYSELKEANREVEAVFKNKDQLEKALQEATETKSRLMELSSAAEENFRTIEEYLTEIEEAKKKAYETATGIETLHEEKIKELQELEERLNKKEQRLDELIEQAQKTLRWTESAGLKTAYENRKEEVDGEVEKAEGTFKRAAKIIVLLAIAILFAPGILEKFGIKLGVTFSIGKILLLSLMFSILYALWRDWQDTKVLRDSYAHKKILAENLVIGSKTLEEELKKEDAVKEFLDSTVENILSDPIQQIYLRKKERNPFSHKENLEEVVKELQALVRKLSGEEK